MKNKNSTAQQSGRYIPMMCSCIKQPVKFTQHQEHCTEQQELITERQEQFTDQQESVRYHLPLPIYHKWQVMDAMEKLFQQLFLFMNDSVLRIHQPTFSLHHRAHCFDAPLHCKPVSAPVLCVQPLVSREQVHRARSPDFSE